MNRIIKYFRAKREARRLREWKAFMLPIVQNTDAVMVEVFRQIQMEQLKNLATKAMYISKKIKELKSIQ